jgi:hypothetical protein
MWALAPRSARSRADELQRPRLAQRRTTSLVAPRHHAQIRELMFLPDDPVGPRDRAALAVSAQELANARARLSKARQRGVHTVDERALRNELLVALESYASAIKRLKAPLPYQLVAELGMCRLLAARSRR